MPRKLLDFWKESDGLSWIHEVASDGQVEIVFRAASLEIGDSAIRKLSSIDVTSRLRSLTRFSAKKRRKVV